MARREDGRTNARTGRRPARCGKRDPRRNCRVPRRSPNPPFSRPDRAVDSSAEVRDAHSAESLRQQDVPSSAGSPGPSVVWFGEPVDTPLAVAGFAPPAVSSNTPAMADWLRTRSVDAPWPVVPAFAPSGSVAAASFAGARRARAPRSPPPSGTRSPSHVERPWLPNPPQRPAQSPQRQHLLSFVEVQDVAHSDVENTRSLAAVNVSATYPWWPVLRCPSVAGFGCPPRAGEGRGRPSARSEHQDDR
jgi:hypothetical protein